LNAFFSWCGIAIAILGSSHALIADADTVKTPVFSVFSMDKINSKGLDLCPVIYEDKIVFISERELDYINYGENRFGKSSYLSLQYSKINNQDDTVTYSAPKDFSNRLNQLNHNGPISFSPDGKVAVFTRVSYFKGNTDKIYRPRIYSAVNEKGKWRNIQPLNINKPGVALAHPSISVDGKYLYFTSDMEGGYGGKDIYVSQRLENGWSEPVNLGPKVNSSGDEVFPFISNDGKLYFSSNGHKGYGNLDLFYSEQVFGKWVKIKHLDSTINSIADDFGIVFDEQNKNGYFSSDRPGGLGKDDIYRFEVSWIKPKQQLNNIAGRLSNKNSGDMVASDVAISLLDEDGNIIASVKTNERGRFEFKNLPYGKSYTIKLEEPNEAILLELMNENDEFIKLANNKTGEFVYRQLSYKAISQLSLLYTVNTDRSDEELTKSFLGRLTGEDVAGKNILLIDEEGNIIATVKANEKGDFVFEDLPYNSNYIIKTEEYEPNIEMIVFNNGQQIAQLATNEKGEFVYVELNYNAINNLGLLDITESAALLDNDIAGYNSVWIKDSQKSIAIEGRFRYINQPEKVPVGIEVFLLNESGNIVKTELTDLEGYFAFRNLPYEKNYVVKIHEDSLGLELELLGKNKEFVKLVNNKGGEFVYRKLSYKDMGQLDILYATDINLDNDELYKTLTGQLTGTDVAGTKVLLINEKGEVVGEAITDDKGNFDFLNLPYDNSYMVKSEKYDPSVGMIVFINDEKIAELAQNEKGEFVYVELEYNTIQKLGLLETTDGDQFIESDIYGYSSKWYSKAAKGKTIAGKFMYQNLSARKVSDMTIYLINENDEILFTTTTDLEGYFSFDDLPYSGNYIVKIDAFNPDLHLVIYDQGNQEKVTLVNDEGGRFIYKHLSYKDMETVRYLTIDDYDYNLDIEKAIYGRLKFTKLPYENPEGLKIYVIDEHGVIIYTTTADKKGEFTIKDMPLDKKFTIMTEDYHHGLQIAILNNESVVAQLFSNREGKFIYLKLPFESITQLALMESADEKDDIFFRGIMGMSFIEFQNELAILSEDNLVAYVYSELSPKAAENLGMMQSSKLGLCVDSKDLELEEMDECLDMTIEELMAEAGDPVPPSSEPIKADTKEPKIVSSISSETILFFEFDSYQLSEEAKNEVQKIANQLKETPSSTLSITSHTDSQGDIGYNLALSLNRANFITNYIVSLGIERSRIKSSGVGETHLAIDCGDHCTAEEHQQNRRAELSIK